MKLPKKSKSFKLDHAYDDHQYSNDHPYKNGDDLSISTITGGSDPPPYADDIVPMLYETPQEKKLRKRSHWVAYATMFVMTVGFSCVISGIWPYLQQLNGNLSKTSLGWVIAANPMGQLIASPLVGYMGNKLGSIRIVCYCTMTLFILGNLMYSFLTVFSSELALPMMIVARFIVGLSSSNVTLCRSYLAVSTTIKERTTGIAIVSAAQALGYVIGPAIQTVISLIVKNDDFKYRATGWVAAFLGVINFFLLTPFIFQEYNIAEKERRFLMSQTAGGEDAKLPKPDYGGIASILFAFFMNQFIYVLIETLFEAFVSDQYAWCDNLAVVVVGISLTIAGLLTVPMFIIATRLAKKFDERKILIFMAFIPISCGVLLFQPMGSTELIYCAGNNFSSTTMFPSSTTTFPITTLTSMNPSDSTNTFFDDDDQYNVEMNELNLPKIIDAIQSRHLLSYNPDNPYNNGVEPGNFCDNDDCYGCPIEQEWCEGFTQLNIVQFYVAFFIVILGYPYGVSMSNAIFSKMLGPKPQGTWMGILTASGSLARVTGPIFVSQVYTKKGTRWTFGVLFIGMLIAIAELTIMFKRLVPMKIDKHNKDKGRV